MTNLNSLVPVIVLCAVLVGWQLLVNRSLVFPALLAPLEWFVVCVCYLALQADLDPISDATVLLMALGIGGFSIGAYAGGRVAWSIKLPTVNRVTQSAMLEWGLVALSALGLVLMFAKAREYYPMRTGMPWFGVNSWYSELRNYLILQTRGSYGLIGYALGFSFAASCYLIINFRRGGLLFPAIASFMISCGFVVLGTGRTFMLLLLCLTIACALPGKLKHRLVLWLIVPIGVLGLFVAIPLLGGRMSLATVVPLFELYFLGPLASLNWGVSGGLPPTGGGMTFRTIWAVFSALGMDFRVIDILQPSSPTKLGGNVYTVFMPYFLDFGLLGVGGFLSALGLLHGWVCRQAVRGNPLMIVANAVLFYALVMQFFQDQYFGLLSQWIQIMGWMFLFVWLRPLPVVLSKHPA